jgi:hypothetical protein
MAALRPSIVPEITTQPAVATAGTRVISPLRLSRRHYSFRNLIQEKLPATLIRSDRDTDFVVHD